MEKIVNAITMAYPKNKNLAELIEEQIIRNPKKVAFYAQNCAVSYQELNVLANQLAHKIQDSLGSIGNCIIVHLDRSIDTVVSILAILKSNNIYVPVELGIPGKLFASIIDDCKPALILTTTELPNEAKKNASKARSRIIYLKEQRVSIAKMPIDNLKLKLTCHLAYVLYTSGTTGKPKGVQITHNGIINLLCCMQKELLFKKTDVLLAITPITFDISGADIYLPLLTGASFVFVENESRYDPYKIISFISEYNITVMQATPPTWQMMVSIGWKNENGIRIISTGEALNTRLALKLFNPNFSFWNLYGPTETTIWSTGYKIESIDESKPVVSIGRPIANTQAYILNDKLEPQQVGEPGELYIGGDGVAAGYLNRPELNDKKFIPNPFSNEINNRLYRTGDLVVQDVEGNLHYLGRIDTQIKIRGHRIEAGAIENALMDYQGIKECVVLDRGPEKKHELVAYLVLSSDDLSLKELQEHLKTHFPAYMVPTKFVVVEHFPVTANGKIDRKNIPNITEFRYLAHQKNSVPLQNKYEEILIDLIQLFLQREDIDPESNFFDLGLHSMSLVNITQALNRVLNQTISVVDLFEHSTVRSFADFLIKTHHIEYTKELQVPADQQAFLNLGTQKTLDNHIAVIGMACKVPGADNYKNFWDLIINKEEKISFFNEDELKDAGISPALYQRHEYVPARGILQDIDKFDAEFFGYTPSEARIMDPQHRIFLEQAWTALEDAGYVGDSFEGKIGVYAGMNDSSYLSNHLLQNVKIKEDYDAQQLLLATSTHYLATKVAYALGLTGPSLTINTACSTGLVAIATACNSLMNQDCDMALAGAITIFTPQNTGYLYQELGILSPDGHCKVFDERANGTVLSNGCGVVVLRRLADALKNNDHILGVIKGWGLNNDGANKVGFTAPSIEGQIGCIKEALERAEIAPTEVEYIEAHGTGTLMGDPIEVSALNKAYEYKMYQRSQYCALGSVKANIGHTDSASGVVGFIKTILALYHKTIPPQINYEDENKNIDFKNSPYYINREVRSWHTDHKKRTAAVHSLGFGGTNAHVIVQEAPKIKITGSKGANLLLLSARTEQSLAAATKTLHAHIVDLIQGEFADMHLADLAYTLQVGRKGFKWRQVIPYQGYEHVIKMLNTPEQLKKYTTSTKIGKPKRMIFGFVGQGSQYASMAADIYREHPFFKQVVDECCTQLLPELGIDLRNWLFPRTQEEIKTAHQELRQTRYTQPALFVIEYALARFIMSLGIQPDAMIGHSIGEYVAATISGVLSLEDALKMVVQRSKLMSETEAGTMLAVPLAIDKIEPYLSEHVELAVHNAPNLCVVSGSQSRISEFESLIEPLLKPDELACQILHTSHAFHSQFMDPILDEFNKLSTQYVISKPVIPYISNVTGNWINSRDLMNKNYWGNHLRRTVLFSEGLKTLDLTEQDIFIEIGPGRVLSQIIKQHTFSSKPLLLQTVPHYTELNRNSYEYFLDTIGRLWLQHINITWEHLYTNEIRQRCALPTYQFDKKSYWVSLNDTAHLDNSKLYESNHDSIISEQEENNFCDPNIEQLKLIWQTVLGIEDIAVDDDFYELGGHSLLAIRLLSKIRDQFNIKIPSTILFQVKTIRGLATVIETYKQEQELYSPLVVLRQGEISKPPLFMVHPIGGTVFCYMQLANLLETDRTVYAFQDPSIEAEKPLFTSVDEMALFYLEHIRKIQETGPYYLCGASFGSLVITEIAHLLEQQNESVNFIGIIDGWGKHSQSNFDIDYVRQIIHLHHKDYSQQGENGKWSVWENLLQYRLNSMLKYKYKKIQSSLVLFKALELLPEYKNINAADNHWSQYAMLPVSIATIPGDHNTMLLEPHVKKLTHEICKYLK